MLADALAVDTPVDDDSFDVDVIVFVLVIVAPKLAN